MIARFKEDDSSSTVYSRPMLVVYDILVLGLIACIVVAMFGITWRATLQ